ncbi:MAG: hypothetical protein IPG48_14770 [Saprospiraceae bacterium]|nr:hypothetical protein [Saprospiraceae bacterium]MBK6667361.1 hypothetical protein [Saprospiraceae bacterium]MBK8825250.1 hypothetical protein [Saprospiraceae bacterium]MBK8888184.1 hypothetical protein [Saprospiraceae bacterium]MBK9580827.1 hypothetical protein [Saprospiraceae bacterium]
MHEINHKYELLNDELVKLNIGDYLISSDFKKLLLKSNATEAWRKFYKLGEAERNFVVASDFNHERLLFCFIGKKQSYLSPREWSRSAK